MHTISFPKSKLKFRENKRQARGCNQLIDLTSELFLHISVAPFTQYFVAVEMIIFTLCHYIYIYIDNIYLKKLISVICKRAHVTHEAILLKTFSRMKPVYFVFIEFNSHLLQIRKVAGWELSAK